jgi:aryl-alcohol dehydrogenase-like predicted oxidoreductase
MTLLDRVGFGCVALATMGTPRAARRLLDAAFEGGIRHFDTAPLYGQGYSERLLGEFLRGKRDQVSVATKFGLAPSRPATLPTAVVLPLNALRRRLRGKPAPAATAGAAPTPPPSNTSVKRAIRPTISRTAVQSSFDASCRALGTDYVDLYLLHEHIPAALETAAVDLLLELRATRRVRTLGLAANGTNYLDLAAEDVAQWEVLQYEFGPAWPAHAVLPRRFPDKTHIFHSCLKNVAALGGGRTPGEVLRDCVAANPRGRVLFSSTDPRHIAGNLRALTA